MATVILSILIFGSAGLIVYKKIKNGQDCEDCNCSCPVKNEQGRSLK